MKLPYPFHKAADVRINPNGTICLVDARDKALARIPLNTAFKLSPESEGTGEGFVYGEGIGLCSGAGKGCGINGWTAGDGGTLKL